MAKDLWTAGDAEYDSAAVMPQATPPILNAQNEVEFAGALGAGPSYAAHSQATVYTIRNRQQLNPEFPWSSGCVVGAAPEHQFSDEVTGAVFGCIPIDGVFCEPEAVKRIFREKAKFIHVEKERFLAARWKANPYERIGRACFMNRAAIKLASLDALFDLSQPCDDIDGPLLFADVCGGPGGFAEYLYWLRGTRGCRGWGMTLRGKDDFDRRYLPGEFSCCYGADGTGDIYRAANMESLRDTVMSATGGQGVHLVVSDGGICVAGEEGRQELLTKRLLLCQILQMFLLLRPGGDFACKLFDMYTTFTVGLLYMLYTHFSSFCILKPASSRPANSERFVVCKGLKASGIEPTLLAYLMEVNHRLGDLPMSQDVLELVPLAHMAADGQFLRYIRYSNEQIARGQLESLQQLVAHIEDPILQPPNQEAIAQQCLKDWGLLTTKRKREMDIEEGNAPKVPRNECCRAIPIIKEWEGIHNDWFDSHA